MMDNLHPKQFKNYMPAAQEGKSASDWLSTNEGHNWQDDTQAQSTRHQRHYAGYEESHTMFSIKADQEYGNSSNWTHQGAGYNSARDENHDVVKRGEHVFWRGERVRKGELRTMRNSPYAITRNI